jgi:pyridoxamine 5'-phosphate oxidase
MITDVLAQLVAAPLTPIPSVDEPFGVLETWLEDARASGKYDDPNAMALASAAADGTPSVRIVLCKSTDRAAGTITFFTNYQSRKGRELADNPRAAAVFHWPHAQRQARVAGPVERVSPQESDAYFRTRPLISQIGACISHQSSPIASRAELVSAAARFAAGGLFERVQRPDHWGGFRIRAAEVELWSACVGRLHQRMRWTRADPTSTSWTRTLLAP